MKIIFLDFDGVINCETAFKDGYCKYVEIGDDHYQSFYPPSKKLLNELIENTNAKIVISSSWRVDGLEKMQRIWKSEKMNGEIIDITPTIRHPDVKIPRGLEIDFWLKSKGFRHINWNKKVQEKYMIKSGIENYIIIDDDSDMLLSQANNFVHVLPSPRNKKGFNTQNYNKALKILNKDIVTQKYG